MSDLSFASILVAIETDATLYHGEEARRPQLLDKAGAEQLLAHLATDLAGLFPEIKSCALGMAGALFDQTQLLRPAWPVFTGLETLLTESFAAQPFSARLLSIGAVDGVMPRAALQPADGIPLGLLQTLPLVVAAEAPIMNDTLDALQQAMEHQFLERGQLSAHSAKALEAQFGIAVTHARFMTRTDLSAMLHLQLEHFGFLPLWQLIDHAIESPQKALQVTGRGGQKFIWQDQSVRCLFETFDHWATHGGGREEPAEGHALAPHYIEWLREFRQYQATLGAHGVATQLCLAGEPALLCEGSYMAEQIGPVSSDSGRQAADITEHLSEDLGVVAITVVEQGQQTNYYPLTAQGLNDIHRLLTADQRARSVSCPAGLIYDAKTRRLLPDTLPPPTDSPPKV